MNRTIPLPSGHVTIVFTDIEGSTRMTKALDQAYLADPKPQHDARTRAVVDAHNGYVVKSTGDGFMLAFQQPEDAVEFGVAIQEAIIKPTLVAGDDAGKMWTIRLRIGVHQGTEPLETRTSPECPADYFGPDVNFAARVESISARGQILVSESTHLAAKVAGPERWTERIQRNERISSLRLRAFA